MTLLDALQPAFFFGLSGMGAAIHIDWQAFKSWHSFNDLLRYNWGLAAWRAFQGFMVGFVPAAVVIAKAYLQGA